MNNQKMKFSGNGKMDWPEYVAALIGTAVMMDIIYLKNTFISDFWTSVVVELICMLVVLVSGKRNFKKSKSISGFEGLGIGLLLVILYVFGLVQPEALMTSGYQLIALAFTAVLYFAIALRD
ncbi:hypothetical protein GYY_03050 [Methanococcus maripaludis X1]|uniref:Uncharacterized protein n=1 Tax=Methanococcus maripaludis X1 TaxID=1053692 RepID=G0H423_METMI|nr:hypothetical protein [Methanococcus maripaludis]AEK19489.1 hypothetical protein GYY_03050 [Methanococcus maripaludis X1]